MVRAQRDGEGVSHDLDPAWSDYHPNTLPLWGRGVRGDGGWGEEFVRLLSAAQPLGRYFCGFSLTGGRRLKE